MCKQRLSLQKIIIIINYFQLIVVIKKTLLNLSFRKSFKDVFIFKNPYQNIVIKINRILIFRKFEFVRKI